MIIYSLLQLWDIPTNVYCINSQTLLQG